jgi:hypothetical protein
VTPWTYLIMWILDDQKRVHRARDLLISMACVLAGLALGRFALGSFIGLALLGGPSLTKLARVVRRLLRRT